MRFVARQLSRARNKQDLREFLAFMQRHSAALSGLEEFDKLKSECEQKLNSNGKESVE